MIISRWVFLRKINFSDKICWENQNKHIIFNIHFFLKSCLLWDNVERFSRGGEATDDNMVDAHFILDTKRYKYTHTLGIYYTNCFFNCNVGCTNAHQCYVIHKLHVLFFFLNRKTMLGYHFSVSLPVCHFFLNSTLVSR